MNGVVPVVPIERHKACLVHTAIGQNGLVVHVAYSSPYSPCVVACVGVMLFCLGRAECPVDTHVWEISKQVGCTGNPQCCCGTA